MLKMASLFIENSNDNANAQSIMHCKTPMHSMTNNIFTHPDTQHALNSTKTDEMIFAL